MRQKWRAQWGDPGEELSLIFLSLEHEGIARLSFQLLLMEQERPVPNEYELQKLGEPFDDRKQQYEPVRRT